MGYRFFSKKIIFAKYETPTFLCSYQINACTRELNKKALIYSLLHQNIQDKCNEHDIEILSPHYRALHDGNMITIPADYLPKDYAASGFRVEKN